MEFQMIIWEASTVYLTQALYSFLKKYGWKYHAIQAILLKYC